MPDGLIPDGLKGYYDSPIPPGAFSGLSSRAHTDLLGFATDPETETALREGLSGVIEATPRIRRGNIRQAIQFLRNAPMPSALAVDVSGETNPLAALEDLTQLVPPDVTLLVVGERQDMDFYRRLSRGLGVSEYLFKPLTAEIVARNFGPALGSGDSSTTMVRGGRVIAVQGARAGVGASTIAANLGWYLGAIANRNTVLLDANLTTGTAALILGVKPAPALRDGLENPGRVDAQYVDRAVASGGQRLDILASEVPLDESPSYAPGAAGHLLEVLRHRYNFIILDLPLGTDPLLLELRERAHQTILVLDATLPSIRETMRLLAMPAGPYQVRGPLLVLNRAHAPGNMPLRKVADALQVAPDILIPDIGRRAREAELNGTPAAGRKGPLRAGIADIAFRAAGVRPTRARSVLARLFG
jgi:pilus assembly protein CpaE